MYSTNKGKNIIINNNDRPGLYSPQTANKFKQQRDYLLHSAIGISLIFSVLVF